MDQPAVPPEPAFETGETIATGEAMVEFPGPR